MKGNQRVRQRNETDWVGDRKKEKRERHKEREGMTDRQGGRQRDRKKESNREVRERMKGH